MKIRKKIAASICAVAVLVSGTAIYAVADGENNHNRSFWREDAKGSYSSSIDAAESGSVWKSNGTIEFVDGNNTLVFDPADLTTIGEELRAINDDDIVAKKALACTIVAMTNQLNQTIDHYGEDSGYKIDVSGIDMNNPSISELEDISQQLSNNYSAYYDIINSQIDEINSNIDTIKTNFTDGCSTIAAAITSQGVSTAANASPATMAANIKTACTNQYNAGVTAGKSAVTIANIGSISLHASGGAAGTSAFSVASTVSAPWNVKNAYFVCTSAGWDNNSAQSTAHGSGNVSLSISGASVTVTFSGSKYNDRCTLYVEGYVLAIKA